jgi:AmmeMemoRadiSam system protein A
VFVSTHREAHLRGCIGRIEAKSPLYETTAECTVSAAVSDHRFSRVMIEELESLSFEISVLSVLEKGLTPEQLEVGRHGLLIEKYGKRGLLLPQVAAQCGWDRSEFLSQTCVKAGLPPEA